MLRRDALIAFRKQLLGWFRRYQRDLPWRRTRDPYRIWLSEIMLQQTRVAAVIPYYERFLERFPDIHALARAPQEEVLRLWSGLGYYSRARNLQRAAQEIVAKHDGIFPRTEKEALALPGIGSYTAAAILSIAYGAKHAVLDGNVARVLARVFAMQGDLRDGKGWQALQRSADGLLDAKSPSDWNQAMMELGATVCTPQAPQCLLCPVMQFCEARKRGLADSIPARRKKRATESVTLATAVLIDARGHTLLLPPPPAAKGKPASNQVPTLVSNLWHFPTIAVRADAAAELLAHLSDLLELEREGQGARAAGSLARRKARAVHVGGPAGIRLEALPAARHAVTYRAITLRAFRVQVAELPRFPGGQAVALYEVASASSVAISNLTRKAARAALAVCSERLPRDAALSARA